MKWQQAIQQGLQESLKTAQGRIVLGGLLVGLWYFPAWLSGLLVSAGQGSAGLPLIVATVYLGLQQLWQQRRELAKWTASEEDRLLGQLLILSGIGLFPFCRFELWSQAIVWLFVLIGIACSSWGARFFARYPLPTLLLALSVYPKPGVMARILWQTFTPAKMLEQVMAWSGSLALRALGQPAVAIDNVVSLPAGSVRVDWGCNGFNMAFTMAAAGLILGLFLKQSWLKTVAVVAIGIGLALLFNIPRIVLLTLASVYWGKSAFAFWHGPWGGQLFSGVLFTVYYYLIMGIAKQRRTSFLPKGDRA